MALLVECNKDLNWFDPESLNSDAVRKAIEDNLRSSKRKITQKILKEYYATYCQDWLQAKIKGGPADKGFYESTFQAFWDGYNTGLFSDAKLRSIIEHFIRQDQNNPLDIIYIKQDNALSVAYYFIDCL